MESIDEIIRQRIKDIKDRCRAAGVTHIHEWTSGPKKVYVGTMLARSVETLDLGTNPIEKRIYIDLSGIEWQIRESIKRGESGIAMIPMIMEDEK